MPSGTFWMYLVLTSVIVQFIDDVPASHAGVVHQTHEGGA